MGASLLLLFLFSCGIFVEALVGRCGHAAKQQAVVPRRHLPRASSSSSPSYMSAYAREDEWQPIRIRVYYGNLNITDLIKDRLTGAIRGATNWFQRTLKVRPIVAPWKLRYKSCLTTDFTGDILSDEFEADFVVYVIADMEQNGWAGYSVYCQVDKETRQPVVGLYYFNGGIHESKTDEQFLSTTIHELTHAMVFDAYLYDDYRKPDGQKYSESELFVNETVRGYNVLKLALPTVTQKAREAFNCSSLNGVELERDGDVGSVGVHWEKRVMYNEYMVADNDVFDLLYSQVTVALFQDSGWYQVSYTYTTPIQWGFHEGCEFLAEKCVQNGVPLTPDFCTEQKTEGCDFMHLRSGLCDLSSYKSPLAAEYQYFQNPHQGGSDAYLDFCPVVKPYHDGDCRDPSTLFLRPGYGEKGGLTSRCFERFPVNGSQILASCYLVDCESRNPKVTIGSKTYTCPLDGGLIHVGKDTMLCPPRNKICNDVPCINNCYGFGYCVKGVCVCDDGTDRCNYEYS